MKCPITREQFNNGAQELVVVIDGKEYALAPSEFKTDSLGWKLNGKQDIKITVIGSKEL